MSVDNGKRSIIESIVTTHPVVLFMKGTRDQPQCGFSARTVEILDMLLVDYATVNVLQDPSLREGVKAYGQWPTIPQVYVSAELIGGCDIVSEMFASGELYDVLGLERPAATAPRVSLSADALAVVRQAVEQDAGAALHLQITARWEHSLSMRPASEQAVEVNVSGLSMFMDAATAKRAHGLQIDVIETLQGGNFHFENPNAPPPVRAMSVTELRRRLDAGESLRLFDVRDRDERAVASITQAEPLNAAAEAEVKSLPADTTLVFHCHSGVRSRAVAEHFRLLGFQDVCNLEGGIDAWSIEVDPTVPRY